MSAKRKYDYRKVYLYVKEWGQKDAVEEFGISPGLVHTIVTIGDAILDKKP